MRRALTRLSELKTMRQCEPVRAIFDVVNPKDKDIYLDKGWSLKEWFAIPFKDMDRFRTDISLNSDTLSVSSFEIVYKPGSGGAHGAFNPKTERIQHFSWTLSEKPTFEVHMQSWNAEGYDGKPAIVIHEDGSAEVIVQGLEILDVLERLNFDFEYVAGRLGVVAKRCIFCRHPSKTGREYGDQCASKFALAPFSQAKPKPIPVDMAERQQATDLVIGRKVAAEGEEQLKAFMVLDFGDRGKLELYDEAWKSSDFVEMQLEIAMADEEVVELPAGEMAGEVWAYEVWRDLWCAIELGKQPYTGESVISVIKMLLFLGDEGEKIATKMFGTKSKGLKTIAEMINDHETDEVLQAAFQPQE